MRALIAPIGGGADLPLANDRLLRALKRQSVDKTPLWLMRQAGRYLPEYRALRAEHGDILNLFRDPDLACEVALQPLRRYALDAAILFSDILVIPDAMGCGLHFVQGEGPRFSNPPRRAEDIIRLPVFDPEEELAYALEAARRTRRQLKGSVPLIGFCGSPWTLATYMIEGGSSANFYRCKALAADQAAIVHRLLDTLAQNAAAFLAAQVAAGVRAVQIFDTWGGVLSEGFFHEFSLRYLRQTIDLFRADCPDVPVIVFVRGGAIWLDALATCGCQALSVDWQLSLDRARLHLGDRIAVQGNFDPALLHASAERIREEVAAILSAWGDAPGHIFNLGHGIAPDVDPQRVAALVDAVNELGRREPVS